MKTATIIITDTEDGKVSIKVDFGEGGGDRESLAHQTAMAATMFLIEADDENII